MPGTYEGDVSVEDDAFSMRFIPLIVRPEEVSFVIEGNDDDRRPYKANGKCIFPIVTNIKIDVTINYPHYMQRDRAGRRKLQREISSLFIFSLEESEKYRSCRISGEWAGWKFSGGLKAIKNKK